MEVKFTAEDTAKFKKEIKKTMEIGFAAKMVEWYDIVRDTHYTFSLTTDDLVELSQILQAAIDECDEHINFFEILDEWLKIKYHPQANFFSGTYIEYGTYDLGCSPWAAHDDFHYDIFLIFHEAVDVPWDQENKFEKIVYEVATDRTLSDEGVANKIKREINNVSSDDIVIKVFVAERKFKKKEEIDA